MVAIEPEPEETNMNLYEEKMPAYLAMSQGDLIAEIIANGEIGKTHLEAESAADDDGVLPTTETPHEVTRAFKIVGIANGVLRERFGLTIDFHYDNGISGAFGF